MRWYVPTYYILLRTYKLQKYTNEEYCVCVFFLDYLFLPSGTHFRNSHVLSKCFFFKNLVKSIVAEITT